MLKTFLVEDEVVIREMIKKMIPWEQYGFELAGEASDGEMALPLILKSKPDLLITDIKMPFMDGLTLCKLVKKELPDIKIVILSGYDDFNYAKQAISIGVEDYLLKPITKNAFIERLEEIHNRYEHEKTQKEYYEKFKLEMQEYERNASRDFFESLVRADFDLEEIYRRADRLNLDIVAEAYNILIFTPDASDSSYNSSEGYSDWEAEVHKKIENYFLSHPVAMLFRHQVFSYAILVKGQRDTIKKNTCECVETIQDFQNDAQYVGGCIAGGRRYLHINANGDVDPCVFIHYSNANIYENTLLEALKSPIFMAYHDGQPFNENMLRPCPMLENPQKLRKMVEESGAKSTDLQSPESVEHLCAKCDAYAEHWAPKAEELFPVKK